MEKRYNFNERCIIWVKLLKAYDVSFFQMPRFIKTTQIAFKGSYDDLMN
jgi:hypothetical protein